MDTSAINLKLRYVIELLSDLWHYHQPGAHNCPCGVCKQKQSLARSIVAKALQEVSLIANCIESSSNYEMKEKLQNDSTASFNFSCGTLSQELGIENTGLKGSLFQRGKNNSDLAANCNSRMSLNISEQRKSSFCSDSLKDSGLNTSQSSQSISPALSGKNLPNVSTMLQALDALDEVSSSDSVKLDESAKYTHISDSFFAVHQKSMQVSGSEYLCNRTVHSPTNIVFTVRNDCPDSHVLKERNLSLCPQSDSLQDQTVLSKLTPQNLMFVPLPFVLPSPCLMEELRKYNRVSQQILKDPHLTETLESHPFCHNGQDVQVTPLAFVRSVNASDYSQTTSLLVHPEKSSIRTDYKDDLTDVFENPGEECVYHCAMQDENINSLRQISCVAQSTNDKRSHYSSKENTDCSASKKANNISCEELSEQQLNITVQSENHSGDSLNSVSSESSSHSLCAVTLQASKNDQILSKSCRGNLKLPSTYGSQNCGQLLVCNYDFCKNSSLCNSSFDSMWRPWEAKDMIIGLICTDSVEAGHNGDKEDNTNASSGVAGANETLERDIELRALNSTHKTVPDAYSFEPSSERICMALDQKDSVKFMNKKDTLFEGSSSGSVLVAQKLSRNSVTSIADKSVEKVIHVDQSGIEVFDDDGTNALSQYKLHCPGSNGSSKINFDEQSYAHSDLSLKHMSNLVQTPEKFIRSIRYQTSPQVSDYHLKNEKENEYTSKLENSQSSSFNTMKLAAGSMSQNVKHEQNSSPQMELSVLVTESRSSQSKQVIEPCNDSSKINVPSPPSIMIESNTISTVKHSAINVNKPVLVNRNINMILPDDLPSTKNSPPNKHFHWGAPAIIDQRNKIVDKDPHSIALVDTVQSVPNKVKQLKLDVSNVNKGPQLELELSGHKNILNITSNSLDTTNHCSMGPTTKSGNKIQECVKWIHEDSVDESYQKTRRETSVTHGSKNCLNQTLPACEILTVKDIHKQHIMNESYEANQSFPKMTRSQQSAKKANQSVAAVCQQGYVSDLQQLFPERLAQPAPRNRRSIFAFSPPDHRINQRFQETGINEDQSKQSHQPLKSMKCPKEFDFKNLWSLLDASDDIGRVPSVQEVLFNCVTSSLCVVDPERGGKIISVNESFQILIGVHEKIVGQRLFRFIKFQPSGSSLGLSLSQSFIFADGHLTNVTGKLAHCINATGEPLPVSVWTVPFKLQPKLTLCVIGVSVSFQAEIYLNQDGKVLMYAESLEDILGLTKETGKVVQIPDLNFSQADKPQNSSLQATDGCHVPVSVTLTVSSDRSLSKETLREDSHIYPAMLSISTNVSGLLVVGSDSIIQVCDKNYFRINLGHCHLERKHAISELLSEIIQISQSSSPSSANSSQSIQAKLNSTSSDIVLADVSRLYKKDTTINQDGDVKESELFLPQSCFSKQWLVDSYNSITDGSDEEESREESVVKKAGRRKSLLILPTSDVPYKTSTPCKSREQPKEAREIVMDNGIYTAMFLHGNGRLIPVTFKLSCIQTSTKALYCLWVYIQPSGNNDEYDDSDGEESETEMTCDDEEDDLKNRLKHLHFDQSVCTKFGDISLGQLLMEQAGLNQSHNASSGTDMLDLEVAVNGIFGQKYMVCEPLGQGSFGFVRRARTFDSMDTVVVKFIKKSKMFDDSWTVDVKNRNKQIPLEVAILREVSHEYIIKLLDFHENESFVQMIMEDFGETDLFDFIDQVEIDEPLACYLFRQILWAVEYLHSRKIIHRDIKDENVIINRNFQCKLIDFGSATYMLPEGELFTKFRGTMEYCSPEVYNKASYRGPELDAWALGITLFTILFRENPFTATEVPGQLDDLPHPVTQDALTLMFGLLEPDPLKRLTVLRAMSCDWLKQIVDISEYNWCELFGDGPVHSGSMTDIEIEY